MVRVVAVFLSRSNMKSMSKMQRVGLLAGYPCGGAAVEFGCDTEGGQDVMKGVDASGVGLG